MAVKKTLIQKTLQAVKHVQSLDIDKDGHNDYSNYDYVSEVQVSQLGHSLASNGVIFLPQIVPVKQWTETGNKGKIKNYVLVQGKFTLTDGTDSITGSMPGIGTDSTDKAIYKAETGAKKNFLMQFFLLASKDDPDNQKKHDNQSSKNYQDNNPKARKAAMEKKPISHGQVKFITGLLKQIDTGKINNKQTATYSWAYKHKNNFSNVNSWVASNAITILKNAPKKTTLIK